jgi:hypothetical protein
MNLIYLGVAAAAAMAVAVAVAARVAAEPAMAEEEMAE